MRAMEACLERGARLVALTPSRLERPLGEALAMAARLCGVPLADPALFASSPPPTADGLLICADVGRLEGPWTGPMAAVLGEPDYAPQWVAQTYGCTERQGLLFASRSLAYALEAARQTRSLVLREADFRVDPEATLSILLRRLDLDPGPQAFEGLALAFGDSVRALAQQAAPDAVANPFVLALNAYADPAPGEAPSAWWDRSLFNWGDDPEQTCPDALDVTGLPRSLVFGPYVTLAVGAWRADVVFDACAHAARRSYRIDFGSDERFSHVDTGPIQAGRNVVSLSHRFESVAPAWVRIAVTRAAFHGELRFHGATVTRLEPF